MTTSSSFSGSSNDSFPSSTSSQDEDFDIYPTGTTLVLKRHIPPPPWGSFYQDPAPSIVLPERVRKLEWCLQHTPKPGIIDQQDTRTITLHEPIRTGHQCGAQVLLTNDGLVAKIYDPLYYCIFDREWPEDTINVTAKADEDYSKEAAAYSAIQNTSIQGCFTPQYFGSWTTDVSIEVDGHEHVREVRLILVEHIKGVQMSDIDPAKLTRQAKDNVMRKVIEADTDLRIAGLKHEDFEPRNIMIAAPECAPSRHIAFEDPDLRLYVIDFAMSCVFDLAGQKCVSAGCRNPLFFWAGADKYSHYGWLPLRREATEWMWEMWGDGGKDKKYIKVVRNSGSYFGRPIWPKE